jgi:hypothetical protein
MPIYEYKCTCSPEDIVQLPLFALNTAESVDKGTTPVAPPPDVKDQFEAVV